MRNILITGTSSETGLGRAIAQGFIDLCSADHQPGHICLHLTDKFKTKHTWGGMVLEFSAVRSIESALLDISNEHECEISSRRLIESGIRIDTLINCAGTHTLDYLENQTTEDFMRVINTNAAGILNMTRAFLPHLSHWPNGVYTIGDNCPREGGTVLNILSTAARVPMTASLAYQASKAAAWAMTEQLARELMPRHGISVFGISPNKLACTGMSLQVDERVKKVRGWDDAYMKKYSNTNICCGEETDVKTLSEFIVFLLSEKRRHKYLAGCILPYGHQR